MADAAIAVRTPALDRVEQVGVVSLCAMAGVAPVLDCRGADAARGVRPLLADPADFRTRTLRGAAFLLAARGLCGVDACVGGLLAGPPAQPHGVQAARAVSHRADHVQLRAREPGADADDGDPDVRRNQRCARHLRIRHPALRRSASARPGHARSLHDLFRPADARHRRRARARAVRKTRAHVGGAGDAGARRRRGAHVHEDGGRGRMRGGGASADAQGFPAAGRAARGGGAVRRLRAGQGERARGVHFRHERPHEP